MRKNKRALRLCGRIMAIVILMSFLKFPVYGEPQTTQSENSSEEGTRLYTDSEIDLLIDDISEIAIAAIEQAAAEAARAAALAAIEREACLLQAKDLALREAERWRYEVTALRKSRITTAVITGLICLLSGLTAGTLITGAH